MGLYDDAPSFPIVPSSCVVYSPTFLMIHITSNATSRKKESAIHIEIAGLIVNASITHLGQSRFNSSCLPSC